MAESVLNRIAFFQNIRNDLPNQQLARELAAARDQEGIRELALQLDHKHKSVRSDCLKVLYEIGYLEPELIAPHVDRFLELLASRDNRMVWGAMIGLGTIASLQAPAIWAQLERVLAAIERGSVITRDWGIRTLARLAAADPVYSTRLFPVLLRLLEEGLPRDVASSAEHIEPAVNRDNRAEFLAVLDRWRPELKPSQLTRVKRVYRRVSGLA